MVVWMEYLFSEVHLKGEIREEWLKLYDKAFIDGIIGVALFHINTEARVKTAH
jgi:hypothetical protein